MLCLILFYFILFYFFFGNFKKFSVQFLIQFFFSLFLTLAFLFFVLGNCLRTHSRDQFRRRLGNSHIFIFCIFSLSFSFRIFNFIVQFFPLISSFFFFSLSLFFLRVLNDNSLTGTLPTKMGHLFNLLQLYDFSFFKLFFFSIFFLLVVTLLFLLLLLLFSLSLDILEKIHSREHFQLKLDNSQTFKRCIIFENLLSFLMFFFLHSALFFSFGFFSLFFFFPSLLAL